MTSAAEQGLTPQSGGRFGRAQAPVGVSLWSWCGVKLPPGVGTGASWEGFWWMPRSASACALPGATGMSYEVIGRRWPLVQGLEAPGRG